MQKKILWIGLVLILASNLQVKAQYAKQDSTYKKWFVGTSLFVIMGNFDRENPPNFAQLDIGGKTLLDYPQKLGNMLGRMVFIHF